MFTNALDGKRNCIETRDLAHSRPNADCRHSVLPLLARVRNKDANYFSLLQDASRGAQARREIYITGNVNTPSSTEIFDSTGLVTQFNFVAVPEPSTYGIAAGLGMLGLTTLSKRRAAK